MTKEQLKELQEILDRNEQVRIKDARQRLYIELVALNIYLIVIYFITR